MVINGNVLIKNVNETAGRLVAYSPSFLYIFLRFLLLLVLTALSHSLLRPPCAKRLPGCIAGVPKLFPRQCVRVPDNTLLFDDHVKAQRTTQQKARLAAGLPFKAVNHSESPLNTTFLDPLCSTAP